MNASWMLNLYPRAWRARYEDEFRAMLAGHPAEPSEMLDILFGAVDAHLRPQLQVEGVRQDAPAPVRRSRNPGFQAFLFAHLAFFILLSIVLFMINRLVTPGEWWAPYVLWGWGMVLVVHAGLTFPWRGLFGVHLALYAVLNAGLIAINIQSGGPAWWVWPVVSLGVLLVTHALLEVRRISLFQAHLVATFLASLELLILPAFVDVNAGSMLIAIGQLWILVLAHWLVRFRGVSLFSAHVVTFIGMMALLTASNAMDESGIWWVRYPTVVWGVILAAHGMAHLQGRKSDGGTWESTMLQNLRASANDSPGQRRQRVLGFHFGAFILGSFLFLLIDLMDAPGQWWAMWPIGVWLALMAVHVGWVLIPRRALGIHLASWLATSAGLIAIDSSTGGDAWWHWPVMWWGVAVGAHVGAILFPRAPFLGMHLIGGLALSLALVATDYMTGPTMWWWYPVAAVAFTLMMHFGWRVERTMIRGR